MEKFKTIILQIKFESIAYWVAFFFFSPIDFNYWYICMKIESLFLESSSVPAAYFSLKMSHAEV